MNELAALLTSFNVSVLFDVSAKVAHSVGMFLSPFLLLIAIYIRLMETQIDGLTGGGKYGTALRDMVLWTFVLGSYYAIGNMVFGFFNPVYVWLDSYGSLAATMKTFSEIMAKNHAALDAQDMSAMRVLVSTPYALGAMLLYQGTLIIAAFITAFLKIANVLAFGVAFIWGLVAIPVSISTTFKILRGWALLLAFALVWPIVQGFLMWMFSELFLQSAHAMAAHTDNDVTMRAANIMMMFSVMHLLLAAVMVAAPFIAMALVSNTSAASGIVMPFVAAAGAAGMATIKGAQARGQPSGGGVTAPKAAGSSYGVRTPAMRDSSAVFAKNNKFRGAGIDTTPSPGAMRNTQKKEDV